MVSFSSYVGSTTRVRNPSGSGVGRGAARDRRLGAAINAIERSRLAHGNQSPKRVYIVVLVEAMIDARIVAGSNRPRSATTSPSGATNALISRRPRAPPSGRSRRPAAG